jgi:hypothetical protein
MAAINNFHTTHSTGAEGGTIKIPMGLYTVKSAVYLQTGIIFSGDGWGSMIRMQNSGVFKKAAVATPQNLKYITFEKLQFIQGDQYNYGAARCFIDFTLCYLSKIDSCYASGDLTNTGESIFTILGDTNAEHDFSHFNTLSNCDVFGFNTPFVINYNRQYNGASASELSNDHRIVFNRFRNGNVHMNSLSLYSGHNKFCFNAIEADHVDDTKILKVVGEANVVIGNRIENHNSARIRFGAEVSGDDNVLMGNHYVGIGIKKLDANGNVIYDSFENAIVEGGSVTMTGDNNVLLEPGTPNQRYQDDFNDEWVHVRPAYSLDWLSIGKNSDFILNGPRETVKPTVPRGITLYNPEAWSGTMTPIRRIPAYDQNGALIGYIPVLRKP